MFVRFDGVGRRFGSPRYVVEPSRNENRHGTDWKRLQNLLPVGSLGPENGQMFAIERRWQLATTLRKGDLAGRVAGRLQGTRTQGDNAVNAVIGAIQDALVSGDRVVITGFGSFEVRQIKERKVRVIQGPSKGQQVSVSAHLRVGFSPGSELTNAVQGIGGFGTGNEIRVIRPERNRNR